jgi:hypothetical protein
MLEKKNGKSISLGRRNRFFLRLPWLATIYSFQIKTQFLSFKYNRFNKRFYNIHITPLLMKIIDENLLFDFVLITREHEADKSYRKK